MNCDFIRSFLNYKIKYLSECASFFFEDYDQELVSTCLKTYFKTYVNTYFYHILGTLDLANDYGYETIYEELDGIKEEILDEYKDVEFNVSNEEYIRNRKVISEMVEICMFMCQLDWLKFSSKESVADEVAKFIDKYPNIKVKLGDRKAKLIAKVKEYYNVTIKVFNDDKSYFQVDCVQELKKDELYLTKLVHNIKTLQTNYKKSMVERVYSDERFNVEKIKTIFWKLPREIMRKFLNGEKIKKYVVVIDDKMFQRGNVDLFRMIDNPFLKRYIILAVSFNSYSYHRDLLEYLDFTVACNQNLLHINEVLDKLNTIDAENFFKYILISDYKDKDKEVILGYKCNEEVELYITKEE